MSNREWVGLCLAGGRSSRFGGEKAAALQDGHPLLAWSLAALAPLCGPVLVSAGRGSEAEALARSLGHWVIYDDPEHAAGPLAGVAAGLAWTAAAGFDRMITLPCDTPLVGAADLTVIVNALDEAPAAYAVTPDGPQSLCAAWRAGLGPDLDDQLRAGRHPAIHRWLAQIGAVPVQFPQAAAFANINTRADLAAMARGRSDAGD